MAVRIEAATARSPSWRRAGLDAIVLGLEVAVFLSYRRPGALDQRGFEPGSTLAQAIGSALAGALVVART